MDAQREMTLDEWVGTLPPIHSARTELEALRRQLAEAEALLNTPQEPLFSYRHFKERAEAAESKLALAEQDARRYRWLRDNCKREWESDMAHDKGAPSLDIDFTAKGHCLDTAIDAAIAASEAKGTAIGEWWCERNCDCVGECKAGIESKPAASSAADIVDAVDDPHGECPTCHQPLHVEQEQAGELPDRVWIPGAVVASYSRKPLPGDNPRIEFVRRAARVEVDDAMVERAAVAFVDHPRGQRMVVHSAMRAAIAAALAELGNDELRTKLALAELNLRLANSLLAEVEPFIGWTGKPDGMSERVAEYLAAIAAGEGLK